jgi:hypothetical protein
MPDGSQYDDSDDNDDEQQQGDYEKTVCFV